MMKRLLVELGLLRHRVSYCDSLRRLRRRVPVIHGPVRSRRHRMRRARNKRAVQKRCSRFTAATSDVIPATAIGRSSSDDCDAYDHADDNPRCTRAASIVRRRWRYRHLRGQREVRDAVQMDGPARARAAQGARVMEVVTFRGGVAPVGITGGAAVRASATVTGDAFGANANEKQERGTQCGERHSNHYARVSATNQRSPSFAPW